MSKKYNISVFIFRRDLRLKDNTGLLEALKTSDSVIPCFILDPSQISDKNNYRSLHLLKFMEQSLIDLAEELESKSGKLYFFHGNPADVLKKIYKQVQFNAVFVNRDYTPFSKERDQDIKEFCDKESLEFESYEDLLLINPDTFLTKSKTPYHVFTPFYKAALEIPIEDPKENRHKNYYNKPLETVNLKDVLPDLDEIEIEVPGGRKTAKSILSSVMKFNDYIEVHDIPSIPTTHLSAHNKFGTVSIREEYYAFEHNEAIIRQLYWRDFFTYIAYHYPYVFGNPFHEKYKNLQWDNNKDNFEKWSSGNTGFPIVDAGMRQLNTTGYLPNRVRLIVGSFLVKDLFIDWQWGEKYFAQQLVDYDPCVNNGNWQWVASTGCDATPYFRVFNPWLQQKKFDPECEYIKTWVPELQNVDPEVIHNWFKQTISINYPKPMLDHKQKAEQVKKRYKAV